MSEEKKPESQFLRELESLGQQLATTVRALWESEESRKLRQDIQAGFVELAGEVDQAIKSAQDSEAAHEFRGQVQQAVDKARQSDVSQEVERGLVSGLQQLNKELSKLVASLERSGTGTEAGQASAPEAATQEGEGEPE